MSDLTSEFIRATVRGSNASIKILKDISKITYKIKIFFKKKSIYVNVLMPIDRCAGGGSTYSKELRAQSLDRALKVFFIPCFLIPPGPT